MFTWATATSPLKFQSITQLKPVLHVLLQFSTFLCTNHLIDGGRKLDSAPTAQRLKEYFQTGRPDDAHNLFDKLPDKNIVTWTMMIYGYARNGSYIESIKLFSQMQLSGLRPNSFTMVAVLLSLVAVKDPSLAGSAHGRIVKSGLESDFYVATAILDVYCKCGKIGYSYKLFKQMKDPCLASFNAMIAGFAHGAFFEKAVTTLNELRKLGMRPNSVTLLSISQACVEMKSFSLCMCIHAYVVKIGLDLTLAVENSVLNMYISNGDFEIVTDYFAKMIFKDVISWTAMIGFLVHHEYPFDALNLFRRMRDSRIEPDKVTMVNLITACAQLSDLIGGRSIHNRAIVFGLEPELSIMNSLIALYSKCGDLYSVKATFDSIGKKNLVTWTVTISGHVQNGHPLEALKLVTRMRLKENYIIDPITLNTSLTACGELTSLGICNQFHSYIVRSGFGFHTSVQNSLMAAYAKCGEVKQAHKVFTEMDHQDVVSWNSIIYGHGINGNGRTAVDLFYEMKKKGEEPDYVTYLSVLNACSHSGLVDYGLAIYNKMLRENKIKVRAELSGCVVDMMARAGLLEEAKEFLSAKSEEASPNVWRAILGGTKVHNDVKLAEIACEKVLELDPDDLENLLLLSNVYKSVGKFKEAEALRLRMRMKGFMKNEGISCLK